MRVHTSRSFFLSFLPALFCLIGVLSTPVQAENTLVKLKTDVGDLTIELFADKAPITVKNFLGYVNDRFYNGTVFHRVIPGFVVQGGGMTFDFVKKETRAAIKNESDNGLKNTYGTLAMARLSNPDSATSQFYINLGDNVHLNPQKGRPGYTVFGRVVEGMELIEKITREPRGLYRAYPEAPNVPVRILNATVLSPAAADNGDKAKTQGSEKGS